MPVPKQGLGVELGSAPTGQNCPHGTPSPYLRGAVSKPPKLGTVRMCKSDTKTRDSRPLFGCKSSRSSQALSLDLGSEARNPDTWGDSAGTVKEMPWVADFAIGHPEQVSMPAEDDIRLQTNHDEGTKGGIQERE
eukprot:scaffold509_cov315-Pavlova_lutheri.AAC.6